MLTRSRRIFQVLWTYPASLPASPLRNQENLRVCSRIGESETSNERNVFFGQGVILMSVANYQTFLRREAHLFIKARARLQRLSDFKFFAGVVESLNDEEIKVLLQHGQSRVLRGDEFRLEITGKEHAAGFFARVVDTRGSVATLSGFHRFVLGPRKEDVHLQMLGERCRIAFGGTNFEATSVDIAENGIGIMTPATLETRSIVEFELATPVGMVEGTGEIRHCRASSMSPNQFRAGIHLKYFDRISRARWTRLINSTISSTLDQPEVSLGSVDRWRSAA